MNLMTPKLLSKLVLWIQNDQVDRFYWTREWRKIKKIRRVLDNNECQSCRALGLCSPAEMVHHIKPVREYPELALSLENLESECNACHNKLHPEKWKGEGGFYVDERW